jgi:WD40 repeat protein
VSFSPDGSTFLTAAADRTLSLWEIPDDSVPSQREGAGSIARRSAGVHTLGIGRATWSSNGRFVAVAEEGGLVRVEAWPFDEREVRVVEGFQDTGLALSADSRILLTVGERMTEYGTRSESRVFETATGNPLGPFLKLDGFLTGAALSLDGRLAVTLNCVYSGNIDYRVKNRSYPAWERPGRIRFWDWNTGKEVFPAIETSAEPLDIALAPGGTLFAVALASGRILLINARTGAQAGALEHGERVQDLDVPLQGMIGFSPDGQALATWNLGKSLGVWDVGNWRVRFPPITQEDPIQIAGFSADGRMLLAAAGGTLTVWDISSGARMGAVLPHPAPVLHAVFRPDGERILTACQDGRVRLWDWNRGRLAASELPHTRHTPSAHFLPDPDLVLTNGVGMTPHVWEIGTGKLLAPPRQSKAPFVSQTFFIDGGRRAVLGGGSLAIFPLDDFLDPGRVEGSESRPHLLARVLSGEKLGAGGLATPLTQEEWLEDWRALRRDHPEECAFDPSREGTVAWHRLMADRMEKTLFWDSSRWHLERLRDLGERIEEGRFLRLERFVRAWHFAETSRHWDRDGPFPELGPEDFRDIEESALRGPVHRSRFPCVSFFDRYFETPCDTTGYALRTIRSPSARKLKLLVGSDDGVRIWLDGAVVHQHLVGRGAVADQDEAWMDLPAGEHRLLVEVTQHYGDWCLYLRFEDEAGRELRLTDDGDLEPIPAE